MSAVDSIVRGDRVDRTSTAPLSSIPRVSARRKDTYEWGFSGVSIGSERRRGAGRHPSSTPDVTLDSRRGKLRGVHLSRIDDEEARIRERPLPDDGFDAEDATLLLEAGARWVFFF